MFFSLRTLVIVFSTNSFGFPVTGSTTFSSVWTLIISCSSNSIVFSVIVSCSVNSIDFSVIGSVTLSSVGTLIIVCSDIIFISSSATCSVSYPSVSVITLGYPFNSIGFFVTGAATFSLVCTFITCCSDSSPFFFQLPVQ